MLDAVAEPGVDAAELEGSISRRVQALPPAAARDELIRFVDGLDVARATRPTGATSVQDDDR